eukprot:1191613-Prorocentrum_minimum.AAC.5
MYTLHGRALPRALPARLALTNPAGAGAPLVPSFHVPHAGRQGTESADGIAAALHATGCAVAGKQWDAEGERSRQQRCGCLGPTPDRGSRVAARPQISESGKTRWVLNLFVVSKPPCGAMARLCTRNYRRGMRGERVNSP